MSIKDRAATRRRITLDKDGHFYYSECLTCSLDCERITKKESSTFSLEKCPKRPKASSVTPAAWRKHVPKKGAKDAK